MDKLVNKLGFKQSQVDEGLFYQGLVLYVLYTNDSLLAGPAKHEVDRVIQDRQCANLNIIVEGDIWFGTQDVWWSGSLNYKLQYAYQAQCLNILACHLHCVMPYHLCIYSENLE
jgi:hypothetical protein